ncbi:hypothetical protein ACWGJX_05705 [Streptomyces sp. NPDC054775]
MDLPLRGWQQAVGQDSEPCDSEHMVLETAGQRPEESQDALLCRLDLP